MGLENTLSDVCISLQIAVEESALPWISWVGLKPTVEDPVGRLAGYGIFSEHQIAIAAYVPDHLRQTNNTAELFAALRALQIFISGEIAICTDSQHVMLGADGAARRWKLRGWVGSSGLVPNVPLWEQLLTELPGRTLHWVKVPSHVTIEDNNEADRLAEKGRRMHPRFPHLRTPSTQALHRDTPSAPKRPRITAPDSPMLTPQRFNFSRLDSLVSIFSAEARSALTTINLTIMPDLGSETQSDGSTVSVQDSEDDSDCHRPRSASPCSTGGKQRVTPPPPPRPPPAVKFFNPVVAHPLYVRTLFLSLLKLTSL